MPVPGVAANVIFTDLGAAAATTLHTGGAIGYLGGITLFIAWVRGLRRGHHNPNVLATGAAVAYISILLNLLGGFIRTYQPGHPSLWDFGTNTWATIMVLKHAALFAGVGATAYMFEVLAPRLKRRFDADGAPAVGPRAGTVASSIVVVSILVASVLGAASTVVDLGMGTEADNPGSETGTQPEPFLGAAYPSRGTVSQTSPQSGSFPVPAAATAVEAVVTGASASFVGLPVTYTITLTSPSGETFTGQSSGTPRFGPPVARARAEDPEAGAWQYEVSVNAGAGLSYDLQVIISGQSGAYLEDTVVVVSGDFYEINLEMEKGDVLSWDWTATDHLDFNVHTHRDGNTDYVVEEHTDKHAGNYTMTDTGGVSLMWEAVEGSDVQLTYKVWGNFTVDSIYS